MKKENRKEKIEGKKKGKKKKGKKNQKLYPNHPTPSAPIAYLPQRLWFLFQQH